MKKTEFTCQRGTLKIRGTRFCGAPNAPIAVISHGFTGDRSQLVTYAQAVADMGFDCYTFDFCGGGLGSESDGATDQMSVLTETEDLKAVIRWACAESGDPARAVTLIGCSQGGFVSALVAAELGSKVQALVLFYPALCIPDDARRGKMILAEFDPKQIPETFSCGPMLLGRCYVTDVNTMDPFARITAYRGPVLILHGGADSLVPLAYSERAARAYGSHCTLKVIEGADHGFVGAQDAQAIQEMQQFLRTVCFGVG